MPEALAGLRLTEPLWLLLLPLLLAAGWGLQRWRAPEGPPAGAPRFVHPLADRLAVIAARPARVARGRGAPWRWTGLVLLVLALAGPVRTGARLPDSPPPRDILFLVDTSVSMLLRDYVLAGQTVDRMTVLKAVLGEFVAGLAGDRLGLILFADAAYLWVPPTRDHRLVRRLVDRIETSIAGRASDLGTAIAAGVHALDDGAPRRTLVLFGHGTQVSPQVSPDAAAAYAAQRGVTLHTVGVGSEGEPGEEAGRTGLLYAPIDRPLLERLAGVTGGRFHWAGSAESLRAALAAIEAAERDTGPVTPRYDEVPLHLVPLAGGLACLGVGAWRGRQGRLGR